MRSAWGPRRPRVRPAPAGTTGAELWETPTTSTLMHAVTPRACAARGRRGSAARSRGRPCARRRRRAPRAPSGAKLRMLRDAGGDHLVGDVLGGDAGVAITPMATPCSRTIALEVGEVADVDAGDVLAPALRVGVEQCHDAEAAAAEAGVVGQRVAEVADPDDDDGPVLGHADLAGDLVAQVVDVVPDAAGAVAAEVGQVLAELGAVDPGGGGELLAGAGRGALLDQGGQGAEVDGQAGDRRLGNVPGAVGASVRSPDLLSSRGAGPVRGRSLAAALPL